MTHKIGFSTGAIGKSDFKFALDILNDVPQIDAVELSALRVDELEPLVSALDRLDLRKFSYVSIHVPSKFDSADERKILKLLERHVAPRQWPMIVHPDSIGSDSGWKDFGALLCIENMDRRKPIGRTAEELEPWFERFPQTRFCFDIGHAQQVDTSLLEAWRLLRAFGNRLGQVHLSHVNFSSKHERISLPVFNAFKELLPELPKGTPIVLESICTTPEAVRQEAELAEMVLREAA